MADKSKVPDYRVFDIVYNSQEHLNRVVCNYSNGKEIWILKKGRSHNFSFRCDRSVAEAIKRKWCKRDDRGYLRPTELGLQELAKRGEQASVAG